MAGAVIRCVRDNNFAYADTEAAIALRSALATMKREHKKSLRAVSKELNYKQAAPLSQMATGRIPIPVERAEAIAVATGLDPIFFLNIVLKQRYPNTELERSDDAILTSQLSNFVRANNLNDTIMKELTPSQNRVLREVLRDKYAGDRWLSPHEVSVILLLRDRRPNIAQDGLTADDMRAIAYALG